MIRFDILAAEKLLVAQSAKELTIWTVTIKSD